MTESLGVPTLRHVACLEVTDRSMSEYCIHFQSKQIAQKRQVWDQQHAHPCKQHLQIIPSIPRGRHSDDHSSSPAYSLSPRRQLYAEKASDSVQTLYYWRLH